MVLTHNRGQTPDLPRGTQRREGQERSRSQTLEQAAQPEADTYHRAEEEVAALSQEEDNILITRRRAP